MYQKKYDIFISYSKENDGVTAKTIKKDFESYGLNVFLAHDDIEGSADWSESILKQISNCHFFIPLLSSGFRKSEWTDQEIGIAVCLGKSIILPIKLEDIDPHGFIKKYQGVKFDIRKIVKIIYNKSSKGVKKRIKKSVINQFIHSSSFKGAEANIEELMQYMPFDRKYINEIIQAIIVNGQISSAFGTLPHIQKLVKGYRRYIDTEKLKKLNEVMLKYRQDDWTIIHATPHKIKMTIEELRTEVRKKRLEKYKVSQLKK